jgi:hypothetical protein
VDIHKISLFEPEEDENFLLHLWSTFYACTMFPFIDKFDDYIYFDHRIDEKRKSKIMHFYKSCVNRYMHARPQKKHYLSKNPSFSPKISSVYESFPDARIIYLVRNPLEMLPSTISWWAYTWHTFSDPKTKYPFVDEIKEFTKHWYQYPLEILDKSTPDSYLILQYDRLFKDTESVVKAIYDKFGYELTPAFQQMLKEKIEKSKGFRSKHTYALEEMGLTQEQILDEYKYVFDRFNFETDPAKICLKKQYNENFLD